jgi:hypothetical protein
MLDRARFLSFLQAKGKDPVAATRLEETADGTVLFFFARGSEPLTLDDKEVNFSTRLGPVEIRTRFVLKDMMYKGKLAV